jgi:hypothetical protein
MDKNSAKNRRFPTLIDLKIAQNTVFTQKYLIRYTFKVIFEEYMNLQIFCCLLRC